MTRAPKEVSISLAAKLGIRDLGSLDKELTQALKSKTIRLDATQVEQIDTAALQLLLGLVNSARNAGAEIQWQGQSDAFDQLVGRLGLATFFESSNADSSDDDGLLPVF